MKYQSTGARLIQAIARQQPQNIVWSPERGWHDNDNEETEK